VGGHHHRRVFITKNVDNEPASAVPTRLDDDTSPSPNRFVSSIYVDRQREPRLGLTAGFNPTRPPRQGTFEVTTTRHWNDLA
jgi:hypothetical protein